MEALQETTRVKRFLNQQEAFEGAGLPPYPRAGQRIPAPTGFSLKYWKNDIDGARCVLTWDVDPNVPPQYYRLNVWKNGGEIRWNTNNPMDTNDIMRNKVLSQSSIVAQPPADIWIPSLVRTPVVISLGAVTTGGIVSIDEFSSTVSAVIEPLETSEVRRYNSPITVNLQYDRPEVCLVDANSAPVVVNLPPLSTTLHGRRYVIKKLDASANAVTVTPGVAAEVIDFLPTQVINVQLESIEVVADRIQNMWWII